jgi:putative FmdB family regulatory protein
MYYEYRCPDCGSIQEENHPMSEDPVIKCEKCETVMKRKIFGGSSTHFKGGGWAGKPAQDSSMAKRVTYKRNAEQAQEG